MSNSFDNRAIKEKGLGTQRVSMRIGLRLDKKEEQLQSHSSFDLKDNSSVSTNGQANRRIRIAKSLHSAV